MERNYESVMSETERETRRKVIVARLLELSRIGIGNSSENEIRLQEMQRLENELHQIDPPGMSKPDQGIPSDIQEERRVRPEDRAAIKNLLDEIRKET